jgi:hypothetical protein|uniref:Mediator complex subunit 15 KIX domain-containing protein n=1 Tax=Phaeodactylum tricornutum TaxID=2850 RepID=A0A8J9SYY1_PHATR
MSQADGSPAAAASPGNDWRVAVQQSYRNGEVREIASVLASLEPGASQSSKLRLAMQFEDAVFKGATSLADYRKKLTKRLKKVQKTYVPTEPTASTQTEKELLTLRTKYGDALRYILQHSEKSIEEMHSRYGEEKGNQFKQHIDGVRVWMSDLGLLENTQLNVTMSDQHLEKLKSHLERRVENIRSHVVKLADPNQFLKETLEMTEKNCQGKASRILAVDTRKRFEQLQKKHVDPLVILQDSIARAQASVPIPTRTQNNDEDAALVHLDKMRAASTTVLAFMMMVDKSAVPRQTLTKAHTVAVEGIDFVRKVMATHRKNTKESDVTLEDAWTKPLDIPTSSVEPALEEDGSPLPKRPKLQPRKIVVRTEVLLTPGRKVPSNLLAALKRKRARLVRPPPDGQGSHLILEFGEAFVMTIYMAPLLVSLKAYSKNPPGESHSCVQSASWTATHEELRDWQGDLSVWGTKGPYEILGHVVEERLRDASAHATYVLRACFGKASKENAGEFEREILEATALLEFLQIVRTSYVPNWEDSDV